MSHALEQLNASLDETIFVGDDVGDLAVMKRVGYAIAVNNAAEDVQQIAHWITPRDGGNGAVRDAIEHIMKNTGEWQEAINELDPEQQVQ